MQRSVSGNHAANVKKPAACDLRFAACGLHHRAGLVGGILDMVSFWAFWCAQAGAWVVLSPGWLGICILVLGLLAIHVPTKRRHTLISLIMAMCIVATCLE